MDDTDPTPLCPCGGICRRRRGTVEHSSDLAVCLRCGKIVGVYDRLVLAAKRERGGHYCKLEEQR